MEWKMIQRPAGRCGVLKSRVEVCLCNAAGVVLSLTSIWGVAITKSLNFYSHGTSFLVGRKLPQWNNLFWHIITVVKESGCSLRSLLCLEITSVSREPLFPFYSRNAQWTLRAPPSHNPSNNYMTRGNSFLSGKGSTLKQHWRNSFWYLN